MLKVLLNKYVFWLIIVSLFVFILERLFRWRKNQKFIREGLWEDLFWLIFNGFVFGLIFGGIFNFLFRHINVVFSSVFNIKLQSIQIFKNSPIIIQVVIVLIAGDFIEYIVHNLLHRVNWMWKIHRLHHSIKTMDWIGNFRFHWLEIIMYNLIKYLPLAILGANANVLLIVAIITTLIGHLNHSNIRLSYGPFRYIINSPRMHIWHHEKHSRKKAGVNFAVVFSAWDWIFKTAYMPKKGEKLEPDELGFHKEEKMHDNFLIRFLTPFIDRK